MASAHAVSAPARVPRVLINACAWLAAFGFSALAVDASEAAEQGRTRVVAVRGNSDPDGSGTFYYFSEPSLNNSGQAAFVTMLTGSLNYGAYRGDGQTLVRLARVGYPAAGGSERFNFEFDTTVDRMGEPAINGLGQVAMYGALGASGSSVPAIIRTDGTTFQTIVRTGDPAPGEGTFGTSYSNTVGLNDLGQVLFSALVVSGTTGRGGLFVGDGTTMTQIVREGDLVPNASDTFSRVLRGSLNEHGQASFSAELSGTGGRYGIYRGDGTTTVQIVRAGQAAPDGIGVFSSFSVDTMNDLGQVAFIAELNDTAGGYSGDAGVFVGSGGTLRQVARRGQAAGSGGGTFDSFSSIALNATEQILFGASIDSATPLDVGIFRSDGSTLQTIVRKGWSAPEEGVFGYFRDSAFNDVGQVAFYAELKDTLHTSGIFLYDDKAGLITVARRGDPLLESTITDLTFGPTWGPLGDERSGLNDRGQVAFRFTLADGRHGVAIWSPVPEPTAWLLLLAGCTLIGCCCRASRRPGSLPSADDTGE